MRSVGKDNVIGFPFKGHGQITDFLQLPEAYRAAEIKFSVHQKGFIRPAFGLPIRSEREDRGF
jgi:hypothetical protein